MTLPVHREGPLPWLAVVSRLNRVMMEQLRTHLHHHVSAVAGSPMHRHVPSRNGFDSRACHIGIRRSVAVSAWQGIEQRVHRDGRVAVAKRFGDDLCDQAAVLGMAAMTR